VNIKPNSIACADALSVLRDLPTGIADALITDPPYSSGGLFRGDRAQGTRVKYCSTGAIAADYAKHSFTGDTLDQRSWTSWTAEWLSLARAATKNGGVAAIFTDWRQIGALTDAVQWAGWIWRGVMVWDKKNARPMPARPRQQCEFIVWASNGPLNVKRNAPYMPGVFAAPPPTGEKRIHQTEKPLTLMREIVKICEVGGLVLDPFAGSGSTLAAAIMEGFNYIGVEKDPYYWGVAQKRISEPGIA
jgi:site-specific DNA-methyltransferase (adenine-specific)